MDRIEFLMENGGKKKAKKLATRLYYSLYGKEENVREYYNNEPAITGHDINGKFYSF